MSTSPLVDKSLEGKKTLLIYLKEEEPPFEDSADLQKYIKYLFGEKQSIVHPINENTEKNTYSLDGETFLFVKDPETLISSFMLKHKEELLDYSNLSRDAFYIPFIIGVNGKLFSNFIKADNSALETTIPGTFENYILGRIADFYEDGFTGFQTHLNNITEAYFPENPDSLTIYDFFEATEEERATIESFIQKGLNLVSPRETLLSISHSDESENFPMHHIHRLIKKEKEFNNG